MILCSLLLALAIAGARAQDPATVGAILGPGGITEIFSNHFGRPGYNVTYDYIIVGGGNAGNAIAARLALDPAKYSIALVEAGSFYEIRDGNRTQVPGYNWINTLDFPIGTGSTPTAIGLNTLPQSGYADRSIHYITGQSFGGGSAVNYMGYHRPTVGTFDKWAAQVDDDFWTWENVYPAYKKSCRFQPPDFTKIDPAINLTWDRTAFGDAGGPLHISYGNYFGPSGPALQDAMKADGFKPIPGLNSGSLIGYGAMTAALDTRTATRDSSETSFLQVGVRAAIQLKLYPDTLVKRVTFDDQKRATGVDVRVNAANVDLSYHLKAAKEVIVSAGVWHSPQILMLSGIGPSATLKKHGIDVVSDLPGVGQNEWDQPLVPLAFKVNVSTNTQLQVGNQEVVASALSDYFNRQSGPLSGVGIGSAVGYEKFPKRYRRRFSKSTRAWLDSFPSDWPEVEYLTLDSIPITLFEALLGKIGLADNYLLVNAILLATQSRGNMTIKSANILDQPVISPNWLLNGDVDLEPAIAAFKRIREIASKCGVIEAEVFPGPSVNSTEAIVSFLRANMNHFYHGVSTCKMGTSNDPTAVVDSRARVFGVTGLRVADASAFPLAPPGHPMASVYMLAEKIAESILQGE